MRNTITPTWPSPPVFYVVTQDSSTQTDDTEVSVSSEQEKSSLTTVTVKRSASFGDQKKEHTPQNDEKALSYFSSPLRRKKIFDNQPVKKSERAKSLLIV